MLSTLIEKEQKVLSLLTKFAVFDKVDTVECETQTEKDLAKLRWTKSKQVRPDDKEDESDQTEEGR